MPDTTRPAFPAPSENACWGMSMREWFAGQALASFQVDPSADPTLVARRALAIADALVAEISEGR